MKTIYNNTATKRLAILLLLLWNTNGLLAQSISGPTSVNQGSTGYYTCTNCNISTWYNWDAYSGSIVSSTSQNITVLWDQPGTQYLYFDADYNGNSYHRELVVTVISSAPSNPPNPTVQSSSPGSVTLQRTGTPPYGVTWYWQTTYNGTSTTNGSSDTKTVTSGSVYYIRAYNGSVWSPGSGTVNYTVPAPYWYYDGDGDNRGDPFISVQQATQPANYVSNNTDLCPSVYGTNNGCPVNSFSNENYVYTIAPTVHTTNLNTLVEGHKKIESITYFDGLGRPMQSIGIRAGGGSEDVITHIEYDPYGRQAKDYLPYVTAIGADMASYRSNALSSTNGFYNVPKYENTTNPFSEKTLEASPLGRINSQAAPGYDWRKGGGNEIEFNYKTNTDTEVFLYSVSLSYANNTFTPTLITGAGFYPANALTKTVTKDENWTSGTDHTTEEFKDNQGRVVLKRTYNNGAHDTYYVYDDFGNLTYVIPPKAVDILQSTIISSATVSSGNSLSLVATHSIILTNGFHAQSGSVFTAAIVSDPTALDDLCYQYKYDQRNRLVEKKIPGKGWEYIVYNKLDQPILTQDANLQGSGKWLFTKYDAFGRVAYTGLFSSGNSRTALQTTADGISTQFVTQNTAYISLGGANVYYSGDNTVYPNSGISEIHTINYYDSYIDVGAGVSEESSGVPPITNVKGLATVSKVRVLDTNPVKWITTVNYYDNKSRPIYVYSYNAYLETTDKVKNNYNFVNLMETTATHDKSGHATITTVDTYTYDHANRLKSQKQKINTLPEELIVLNTYDELGQLENKKVGGAVASTIANSTGLQTVNYTYNIRGWLKQINNPASLGTDLFGFEIKYNDIADVNKKLFNGNISQTLWNSQSDNTGGHTEATQYTYSYDALNRITGAISDSPDYNLDSVNYDKNGNILHLKRYGHRDVNVTTFGLMDDLAYTYQGNQLKAVDDATSASAVTGFVDGAEASEEYWYDTNGNMTKDLNKGISMNMTYNHLNLPTSVVLPTGNISYIYDATGTKLSKTVNPGNTTYYAGNYVYEGSSLKFFNHVEGYVEPINPSNYGSGFNYVYQYKDHLGNVRLSYRKNVGSLEILEENNYYPFGLKHKGYNSNPITNHPYKYNGVELNESLGLNLYEMDFRHYDPAIGRFNVIDEMAENAMDITPYRFGFNNPIYFSDPTGLWEEINGGYSTNDPDEIARLYGYLNYRGNTDASTKGIMNFIKEDIAFDNKIENSLSLSTAYVQGGKITDHSIHRMKNEMAYYNGTTNYLYTREDYEMRNRILADGRDPISSLLLDWEKTGAYQPITAKNYIDYVGGPTTAQLLTVSSFMDMMGSVGQGPVSISRSVTPRYLGTRSNQGSLASRQNFTSNASGASINITPSFKNMSFAQFRQQYSHLYIGKFRGSGNYMKFMSMDFKAIKAGLRD